MYLNPLHLCNVKSVVRILYPLPLHFSVFREHCADGGGDPEEEVVRPADQPQHRAPARRPPDQLSDRSNFVTTSVEIRIHTFRPSGYRKKGSGRP